MLGLTIGTGSELKNKKRKNDEEKRTNLLIFLIENKIKENYKKVDHRISGTSKHNVLENVVDDSSTKGGERV